MIKKRDKLCKKANRSQSLQIEKISEILVVLLKHIKKSSEIVLMIQRQILVPSRSIMVANVWIKILWYNIQALIVDPFIEPLLACLRA